MASSVESRLKVTRQQILAFRRRVGALDERMPMGSQSLRRAAWAGLQDSMPRAALLSLHARVDGVESVDVGGPVARPAVGPSVPAPMSSPKRDFALFSLGRLPDNAKGRLRAERMAELLHAQLGGADEGPRGCAHSAGNAIRYAATTGTVAIRWEGARAPTVWTVAAARSTLPTRVASSLDATSTFSDRRRPTGSPAGQGSPGGRRPTHSRPSRHRCCRFDRHLATSGCSQKTSRRFSPVRRSPRPRACCRAAMPTFCSTEQSGTLLVPREDQRQRLWTPRVWPGALLVEGEIRGTWRRAQHTVRIDAWARLSRGARDAIEAEASSLPLPGLDRPIEVVWHS